MENMECNILVLMSTYNGEKFIYEQINSILSQQDVSLTLLIRDDGSIDNTKNIIQHFVERYPGKIIYQEGANLGFAGSFTELLKIAFSRYPNFNYFAFADQDDVWEPLKLFCAIQMLHSNSISDSIPITYCSNTKLVDVNLNFIKYAWKEGEVCITKPRSLIQNFATGCTMVFNKKAVELYVSNLPDDIKRHDALMCKICLFLGKVVYDNNSYIKYRQHTSNQIGMPGIATRMKYRLRGKYKKSFFEFQNRYFLRAYKNLLSLDDIMLISQVAYYKTNVFTRLSLLFNRKIRYGTFEARFLFVIKVFLGWL